MITAYENRGLATRDLVKLDEIGRHVIDSAYAIHKKLGPGLLDKVYEVCFCHELIKRKLTIQRHIDISITYDGLIFQEGLQIDLLVERCVICDLNAQEPGNPCWAARLQSYMKLTNIHQLYLINFNVSNIGMGIKKYLL